MTKYNLKEEKVAELLGVAQAERRGSCDEAPVRFIQHSI